MRSDYADPLNLGTDSLVSINELVDVVAQIAGKTIFERHDLSKPQGVRGRNSDNDRLRKVLSWEPSITLEDGIAKTYPWIEAQLAQEGRVSVRGVVGVGSLSTNWHSKADLRMMSVDGPDSIHPRGRRFRATRAC